MKSPHTPAATLLPPIWEKNYNISRLLSIYTHNIIYELTEQISGKKYILKILDKKYFHKKLYQVLSSANCDLFLLPIDVSEDSQFIYFIYEYCPCLTDLLIIKEFSYEELSIFVQDIGNAILFLHKNNITHRDIAPGNIFMKENGHFLLGDFSSSLFEEKSFLPNLNMITAIFCKIKNFGCHRTGNTPFFSPPDYSNRKNGYFIDCYGFSMLLYLLFNEFKPPSEEDYVQLYSFSNSKHAAKPSQHPTASSGVLTHIYCQHPAASSGILTQNHNNTSIPNAEIKELLLSILAKSTSKEPTDFHVFFDQLKDIFQNTAAENLMFHTTIIKQENTDFFLRTASLNNRAQKPANSKQPKQQYINQNTMQNNKVLTQTPNKPKLAILLYGFLFLSILLFSISFYRSLTAKQQEQTNITQSVLSGQDRKIFMNKQNLTSVDFLQENHSVEILVLSENNISSVKPLAGLSQLLILDLSCNQQLTDILSLTNLPHLQQLILTDTNITEEEHAILQNALPDCIILY